MPTTGQRLHWSIDYDTARQGPHFGERVARRPGKLAAGRGW